jgi:predicted negative regulator of RcsB-dependent stress response
VKVTSKDLKELKKPDGFITTTAHFIQWASKNTRTVATVGGGALAILAGFGIWMSYQTAQLRDANIDLAVALSSLAGGQVETAESDLDVVTERWAGSRIGNLAAILAANTEVRQGNYDQALGSLEVLSKQDLPPYLHQQILLGWASALEGKGELAAASAKYGDAAAAGGPYTGDAVIGQARTAELQGLVEVAADLYRKAYEQFPDRPDREQLAAKSGV